MAREDGAVINAMMDMAIAMLTLEPGLKIEPYETITPPPPPSPTWNIRKPPTFKNIAEKKNAMVGPQKNLLVSRKSFSAATINLDSKKSEQASEVAAAVTEHKMITNEALKTKLANIEARESTLDAIKKTAERKFEEEKKFVEEYCASSATFGT